VQLLSSASSFVEIDPAWQYVVVGAIAIAAASLFGLSRQSSGQGAANH
jgi:ABC-type glucose/galactose transport system permease subunit